VEPKNTSRLGYGAARFPQKGELNARSIGGALGRAKLAWPALPAGGQGQARLLLGPGNVIRIDPTLVGRPIELDDYKRAMDELLPAVSAAVAAHRAPIEKMFLKSKAEPFVPVP
jgi:hypothetical protein